MKEQRSTTRSIFLLNWSLRSITGLPGHNWKRKHSLRYLYTVQVTRTCGLLFLCLNFFATENIVLESSLNKVLDGNKNYEKLKQITAGKKAPYRLYIYLCLVLINPSSQESEHMHGSQWQFTCARHQEINMTYYGLLKM